jgi:hypothetical protein
MARQAKTKVSYRLPINVRFLSLEIQSDSKFVGGETTFETESVENEKVCLPESEGMSRLVRFEIDLTVPKTERLQFIRENITFVLDDCSN